MMLSPMKMKKTTFLNALLLLLCITSCGTHRQVVQTNAVPSISAEDLYALIPSVEAETPSVRLFPKNTIAQRKREEDLQRKLFADSILSMANRYLGTPYGYGSLGPRSFDCSGFVRFVYSRFGYDLPHSSTEMSRIGRPVASSVGHYGNLQKGDIVLFAGRRNSRSVGHVGICIATDPDGRDGTFIHAAVHGGVIVSRFSEEYYTARYHGARRII